MFGDQDICEYNLVKEIKMIVQFVLLFPDIAFHIMKLLAKDKAGKTMIKESSEVTNRLNCI